MTPGLLVRIHRINDSVEVLENSNMTFPFKGPWFAGKDVLITVDPANIQHIVTSNFSNYIKGAEFQEIFEVACYSSSGIKYHGPAYAKRSNPNCPPEQGSGQEKVPPIGLSGGLALLWNDDTDIAVLESSPNVIDTRIVYKGVTSFVSFIYGPCS
ncbi:hypothetical protein DY000_02009142 [Brassica cretica]|uniref:Amine oxidase n=1 Tax=Brassica cretica TaxID=69181 RepID=A0ABQ7BX53_BRACR|nr:hypothetical protein DY000_02009142 [Brassica cretica]